MEIVNIGIYPPPYGGVSNHLKRLLEYLLLQKYDTILIDLSRCKKKQNGVVNKSWYSTIVALLLSRRKIIHFHNFSVKNIFVFFLLALRHKTILSFHNERFLDEINNYNFLIKQLAVCLLNKLNYIIVDNEKCRQNAEIIIYNHEKIILIPEFIPPIDIPELDNEIITTLRNKHKYLISANAFQISFHNNQDLYGIDILIQMVERLVVEHNIDVVFVFLLPNIGDQNYFDILNMQLEEKGIKGNFRFITTPLEEASSLWKISDLVIRATNTDGNSLTILEALSLGIPVVASNCVERPQGTIIFKSRSVNDLVDKVKGTLLNIQTVKEDMKNIKTENNAHYFLELYQKMENDE